MFKKVHFGIRYFLVSLSILLLLYSPGCKKSSTPSEVSKPQRGDKILAQVGSDKITLLEFESEYNKLPPHIKGRYQGEAGKKQFLDQIILTKVMYQSAVKKGYDKNPDVIKKINDAKVNIISQEYFNKEIKPQIDNVVVPEAEIQNFYETHKSEYIDKAMVRARHIQVADEKSAKSLRDKLLKGEDFEKLARENSTDKMTSTQGGLISGWIVSGSPVPGIGDAPEFVEMAFKTDVGKISDIVKTNKGYHIIKVEEKKEERQRKFDEVKQQIESNLKREKQEKRREQLFDSLKTYIGVKEVGSIEKKDKLLVIVGDDKITIDDFESEYNKLPPLAQNRFQGEEGKKEFLNQLILIKVVYQAGVKKGYANNENVLKNIEDRRVNTISQEYFDKEIRPQIDNVEVNEAEVQNFYNTHQEQYTIKAQVRVRHILVSEEKEANELRDKLLKGEDFEKIAKEKSIDQTTSKQGGLISGWLTEGGMVAGLGSIPEFMDAALKTDVGKISEVVKTDKGYHIIKVEEKKDKRIKSLDEVKSQIEANLRREKQEQKRLEIYDNLKKEVGVSINENLLKEQQEIASKKTIEELFELAQQSKDPNEAIKYYEQILKDYPNDKNAYKAQFMMGFVYSEQLKDYEKAKQAYKTVIDKYPNCDLVDSAKYMLENMGKEVIIPDNSENK